MIRAYICVTADGNDADYVTKVSEITEDQLANIMPIINKINNYKGNYNWPDNGYRGINPMKLYNLTSEEYDNFSGYIPYWEEGVHTITDIDIIIGEKTKLL